jgi:hypothetical protein
MKKTLNYEKELYRGAIKQIMKVRGLRTISLANYNKWLGVTDNKIIHSVKLDVQDGYVNIYGYKNDKCGEQIEDGTSDLYHSVYNQIMDIVNTEKTIPNKIKRNILVKVFR